jgi:hypothetical protein
MKRRNAAFTNNEKVRITGLVSIRVTVSRLKTCHSDAIILTQLKSTDQYGLALPREYVRFESLELALQDFANKPGIRFALAQLHDLTFKEVQGRRLSSFVIGDALRITRDDFVAKLFDS